MKCYEQQKRVRLLLTMQTAETLVDVLDFVIQGQYFDAEYDKDLERLSTNVNNAIRKVTGYKV